MKKQKRKSEQLALVVDMSAEAEGVKPKRQKLPDSKSEGRLKDKTLKLSSKKKNMSAKISDFDQQAQEVGESIRESRKKLSKKTPIIRKTNLRKTSKKQKSANQQKSSNNKLKKLKQMEIFCYERQPEDEGVEKSKLSPNTFEFRKTKVLLSKSKSDVAAGSSLGTKCTEDEANNSKTKRKNMGGPSVKKSKRKPTSDTNPKPTLDTKLKKTSMEKLKQSLHKSEQKHQKRATALNAKKRKNLKAKKRKLKKSSKEDKSKDERGSNIFTEQSPIISQFEHFNSKNISRDSAHVEEDMADVANKQYCADQENNCSEDGVAKDVQTFVEDDLDSGEVNRKSDSLLVFDAGRHALVVLKHPDEVRIRGRIQVKCLCGSLAILGFLLKPGMSYHNVYSPSSSSYLTLKTVNGEKKKSTILEQTTDILSSENQETLANMEEEIVVLKLKRLESNSLDYATILRPLIFSPFLSESFEELECNAILSCLGVKVLADGDVRAVEITEDFLFVADKVKRLVDKKACAPVILVCGGKNTGKSTMNRFLINTLLNSVDKVFYMECDIGQTEFTPPGCVSLQCVNKPLLGPPFCHQWEPIHSSFFGGLSAADDPKFYIECIKDVYKTYTALTDSGPLIVNTMGWNKGLGLMLLTDTVQLTVPSLVIQFDSYIQHLNLPAITPGFIARNPGWSYTSKMFPGIGDRADLPVVTERDHELIVIGSLVESHLVVPSTKMRPIDHRNLSLLSYLSTKIEPGMTLCSITPYTVGWDSVAVCVCHTGVPDSQILYALNASVVALCQADMSKAFRDNERSPWIFKKIPLCKCLGFGIVRGIDPEKKLFYITTPLSRKTLQKVNTLIRGSVNIPDKILLRQECNAEDLLYTSYKIPGMQTNAIGAHKLRRRQHMPRKSK